MRSALLCNGPSRVAFNSRLGYNYVIGCNIPWTEVDSTVIYDIGVLQYLKDNGIKPTPFWTTEHAWKKASSKYRDYVISDLLGILKTNPTGDSSGHMACRKLIELGYKEIDIYGCDSWWQNDTTSYTHQYVDGNKESRDSNIKRWRNMWETIIKSNQDVKINFIGEPK